eukprot:2772005-Alexandrium_andersonii.AAC.1
METRTSPETSKSAFCTPMPRASGFDNGHGVLVLEVCGQTSRPKRSPHKCAQMRAYISKG